jgi:predicted molibdopterin-dependent oxidoreductase YjgC
MHLFGDRITNSVIKDLSLVRDQRENILDLTINSHDLPTTLQANNNNNNNNNNEAMKAQLNKTRSKQLNKNKSNQIEVSEHAKMNFLLPWLRNSVKGKRGKKEF